MSWGRWDINRLNSLKEIHKRCDELRESLRNLESGKEDFKSSGYFEFFPVLLVNLFGFDNKPYVPGADGELPLMPGGLRERG